MRPASSSALGCALACLLVLILLPLQGAGAQTCYACSGSTCPVSGCQCSCDGLSSLPPQNPPARDYQSFITQAYLGAYGQGPTCAQKRTEYWNLVNAGSLLDEAERFVATLFETQQSNDGGAYAQTAVYELRNAASNVDRSSIESFVADLYHAFLQRSPDLGGQCFWSNNVCSPGSGNGRQNTIQAFKVSDEFGNLVNGLYDGGAPCCPTHCPSGYSFDCDLGDCTQI